MKIKSWQVEGLSEKKSSDSRDKPGKWIGVSGGRQIQGGKGGKTPWGGEGNPEYERRKKRKAES